MFGFFDQNRAAIEAQYKAPHWNETAGWDPERLQQEIFSLNDELEAQGVSRQVIKARLFEMTMDHAQIAAEPKDFFQDHIRHGFLIQKVRSKWVNSVMSTVLKDEWDEHEVLAKHKITTASYDFGHTVPDWYAIMELGLPGLLARVEKAHAEAIAAGGIAQEQEDFYTACEITYRAAIRYMKRMSDECRRVAAEQKDTVDAARLTFCADELDNLCLRAPESVHEALQLAYMFHILQEEIEGERLRSLGCLDRVYWKVYQNDLSAGRYDREQISELFKDFFQKFHALTGDQLFGEPMCLGGTYADGSCSVNELTWLIIDSYDVLDLANPKFHIRISNNTPREFIARICDCIRGGNSSFVFVSDECAIPMMMKVGASKEDAHEYVPIGCYEPGILGREVACTGNGGFVLPKALELALHNGVDPVSGLKVGVETGEISAFDTFDKLLDAVRAQMKYLVDKSAWIISTFEKHYLKMTPSPLFSGTMVESVEKGVDAFNGGAKYNNSSLYMYSNATLVDSLAVINKLVYQNKEMTLGELSGILDANWEGHEMLRLRALRDENKWGNDRAIPDDYCVDLCEEAARYINSLPNGRGGRFKAAMYTIDHNYQFGEHTGATADGRRAGEITSRNLGASSGMDRSGVTALMRSCAKLDLTEFPTGTVVDIMLHPTAVAGDSGLEAFTSLIVSYMEMGGYAIHGNVFDAKVLRAAQENPEAYKNLQVRVCGWNVYFVNLNRAEQDEFIRRAELAQAG